MEATILTGWVYDFLRPQAIDLKVAHPEIGKKYFGELLEQVDEIPPSAKELLKLSRFSYEIFCSYQKRLKKIQLRGGFYGGCIIFENCYLPVNPIIAGLDLDQAPADLHNSNDQAVVHKRSQFFF